MSAAAELRTAASILRDLAARAADDTLMLSDEEAWLNDGPQITSGAGHWMLVAEVKTGAPGETDPAVAEYITTMDPLVGAALADLLDKVAEDEAAHVAHSPSALAIARLINRRAS